MPGGAEDKELIRQQYKPDKIKVVLVGESPPASRRFFYEKGDPLTQYTQEAFAKVYEEAGSLSTEGFFEFFKEKGFYLDDLCLVPVNDLPWAARKARRSEGVAPLAARLAAAKPEFVVAIMKGIGDQVREATLQAGLSGGQYACIPYGGNGNQGKYRAELVHILLRLKANGTLE